MLFSIVVPVYNSQSFLGKAIQSVIDQSYENWELILINDGSTDSSADIMRDFSERDGRIHCYSHENIGVSKTRNRGIVLSKGDYVMFLDADDEIDPSALQKIYDAIMTYQCDVVEFNAQRTDVNGRLLGKVTTPLSSTVLCMESVQEKLCVFSALASGASFALACNFAVKKDLVAKLSYPTDMILLEDLVFCIRMYEGAQKIVCLPDFLYFYRDNPGGCVNNFNYRKIEDLKIAYTEKLSLAQRYGLDANRPLVLKFFMASLVGFYYSMIDNGELCKQYCQKLSNDGFVLARLEEFKCLEFHKEVPTDYIFASSAVRGLKRGWLLAKKRIRRIVKTIMK